MGIKVHRRITRRITVTAADVYECLAEKFDLPRGEDTHVQFEDEPGMIGSEITLIVTDAYEQELTS